MNIMNVQDFIVQRNFTIYQEFMGGKPQQVVADFHQLSKSRVKAIVAEVRNELWNKPGGGKYGNCKPTA